MNSYLGAFALSPLGRRRWVMVPLVSAYGVLPGTRWFVVVQRSGSFRAAYRDWGAAP